MQTANNLFIRNFQQSDMPQLSVFYQAVKTRGNVVFWWVGDENNYGNVFCVFENSLMIAKGQVDIINIIPPDRSPDNKHAIYLNLKTLPDREQDYELMDKVYAYLYQRALELKETLPPAYETQLCVGNDSSEVANNQFFIQKGYRHLKSLFTMTRDLNEPIAKLTLDEQFHFSHWKMESPQEETEYLKLDAEIWPDATIGSKRLADNKNHKLWTSMVVRKGDTIVAGLMAWQEGDDGVIEDVFVREPWRKRGLAKFLLTAAFEYLKSHGLQSANLMVLTDNHSALSLYESVGFQEAQEEIRYCIDLK